MRTTIELPDDLLIQAKSRAVPPPPLVDGPDGHPLGLLTPEQIDEAMFG